MNVAGLPRPPEIGSKAPAAYIDLIQSSAIPFDSVSKSHDAFTKCFDSFGDCKVLLIGDASHGTSEFYAARAEITKYMIENHGFNIVAGEADWPDAETVDRYVRSRPGPGPAGSVEPIPVAKEAGREAAFTRFPTWMWRNLEVHGFVEWLRRHNRGKDPHDAVGFYGLDLYSLGASIEAVIDYLDNVDPNLAEIARRRYHRLLDWAEEPQEYGLEAMMTAFQGYENEVVSMLKDLLSKRLEYSAAMWDGEEFHSGEQNAQVVVGELRIHHTPRISRIPPNPNTRQRPD